MPCAVAMSRSRAHPMLITNGTPDPWFGHTSTGFTSFDEDDLGDTMALLVLLSFFMVMFLCHRLIHACCTLIAAVQRRRREWRRAERAAQLLTVHDRSSASGGLQPSTTSWSTVDAVEIT